MNYQAIPSLKIIEMQIKKSIIETKKAIANPIKILMIFFCLLIFQTIGIKIAGVKNINTHNILAKRSTAS